MCNRGNMKISDLTDCPSDTETDAKWYFDEWDCKDPKATLEGVIEKVSSGVNRTAFVTHVDGELVGAGEFKHPEYPSSLTMVSRARSMVWAELALRRLRYKWAGLRLSNTRPRFRSRRRDRVSFSAVGLCGEANSRGKAGMGRHVVVV
jgi:hypothetical protein